MKGTVNKKYYLSFIVIIIIFASIVSIVGVKNKKNQKYFETIFSVQEKEYYFEWEVIERGIQLLIGDEYDGKTYSCQVLYQDKGTEEEVKNSYEGLKLNSSELCRIIVILSNEKEAIKPVFKLSLYPEGKFEGYRVSDLTDEILNHDSYQRNYLNDLLGKEQEWNLENTYYNWIDETHSLTIQASETKKAGFPEKEKILEDAKRQMQSYLEKNKSELQKMDSFFEYEIEDCDIYLENFYFLPVKNDFVRPIYLGHGKEWIQILFYTYEPETEYSYISWNAHFATKSQADWENVKKTGIQLQ